MPHIETVEELADTLADWLGIYGSCKSDGEKGCIFDKEKPFCCRMGFTQEMQERICQSVANESVITALNERPQTHSR